MISSDSAVSSKGVVSSNRGISSNDAVSVTETESISRGQQPNAVASRRRSVHRAQAPVDLWHCLVASARPAHGQWLADAARRWGWDVSVCSTPTEAQRSIVQMRPQLAFVDLQRPEGEAFCALVEQIASECKTLLVVCGNEEDGAEEIWIRELGAWFYLPGMQPGASVALLFRDARTIAERQAGNAPADRLLAGGPRSEASSE
jgi:hypothetical protein